MGGGLMQLVAYGAQDIYLTGNPQITFFKVVYRRHTNFSMETIAQTFSGTGKIGTSTNTATATISRNGDLIHKMYINCDSPGGSSNSSTIGSEIVQEAELEIGGQKIDKHWKSWNNIWNELSTPESKAIGLKSMQADIGLVKSTGVKSVQVPLNFWFCRNPGLALPLIALQYHEVKVNFKFGSAAGTNLDENDSLTLFVDYIYLDTDERRRFAQVSHEYLIEQIQKQDFAATDTSVKLIFNHPVKELIWTTKTDSSYTGAQLKLNGHDRFASMKKEYFQLRQPFDYHTAVPKQNLPTSAQLTTLDRQTQLTELQVTGGLALGVMADAAPGGIQASAVTFDVADGSLGANMFEVQHASVAPTETTLVAGEQIAIVCNASGTTNFGVIGKTYFANVLETKIEANVLQFTTTTPTEAVSSSPDTLSADSDDGSGTFSFFKVTNGNSNQARTSRMTDNINVYSFALKPEEHQPSGTCNFSRIDTAILDLTGNDKAGEIYAVNYNVLRIMSGMGGLAYSN